MEFFNIFFTFALVVTFCKCKNNNALSLQTCNVLKGISILAVFIGHTSKVFTGLFLYKFYCSIGLFAVSVFFFISGYGLMYAYLHKKNYKDGFLKKRCLPLMICYVLACLLQYGLNGDDYLSFKNILMCGYVPFSWFILSILCLYLMFYIAISIFKNNANAVIATTALMLGLFIVMASIIDVPYTLLGGHQMLVFIIGMMVCTNYKRIMCGCKILSGGVILMFPLLWAISLCGKNIHLPAYLAFINTCLQSYIFPFFVMVLLSNIKVQRMIPFWIFLQKHSLQVYLVHGIILYACIERVDIPSEIFIFLIFILTIICAVIMKYVENKIIMLFK